jgi:catechol 2,3-dioxygenase-like lactoylglutathione lyase family enzyme
MQRALKTARVLFACLLGCSTALEGHPADGDSVAAPTAEFRRANLVVTDIDRALQVYRDVLGFMVDGISESSAQSYSYPVFQFPREAKLRFATLSTSSQLRTLALTEVKGVAITRPPVPHLAALVIRVDDIEAVILAVRELGLDTVPATRAETPEGDGFIEQAFVDFDGHLIVLYQLLQHAGR